MIEVRPPANPDEFAQYESLRWRILRQPWTNERASNRDEQEAGAIHLTAWIDGKMVGAGRVQFNSPAEALVRGMAVEQGFAGRGVGRAVLLELERRARELGAHSVVLHARETAIGFYQKLGYSVEQPSYKLYDAIAHWRMRKAL